jgi:LysM repeat protein
VSDVTSALRDTYIPDEFFVKLLACVCWLVWFQLMTSLLVEAIAYVRGRRAGAVPLAGGVQKAAARLVATVALIGALAAARQSTHQPTRHAQDLLVPTTPAAATLLVDDAMAAPLEQAAPAEPLPTYEVQRRDTLWDIAERHLGDPFRWQEIFQLNEGHTQPDGRCLTDPDLIMPGWQLQLPGDALGLAPVAPPAPAPAPPTSPPAPAPPSMKVSPDAVPMVMIDDGAGGDVLLASEAGGGGESGMVLLPDGSTAGGRGSAVVAQPGEHRAGDETAARAPGAIPAPSDDKD